MQNIKYAKNRKTPLSQFFFIFHSIDRAKNNKSEYARINIYRYITTKEVVVVVVVVVVHHHHHHQRYPSLFKTESEWKTHPEQHPRSPKYIILKFQLGPTASPKHSELLQIPHWSIKVTKQFLNASPPIISTNNVSKTMENRHTQLAHYHPLYIFYKSFATWHHY